MAANSKHYGDVFLWLKKVIASCQSEDQLASTERMISNFVSQLKRDGTYMIKIEKDLDFEVAKVAKIIG